MAKIISNFTFIFCLFFLSQCSVHHSKRTYIDPTGTYSMDGNTTIQDGEKFGCFGSIQVKLVDRNRVIMTFYVTKGAPSYNSGSFVKLLDYDGSKAIYTDNDSTDKCMTTFVFSKKGVEVKEKPDMEQICWGNGVIATGYFKKKSSKEPILKNPLTGELILDEIN